MLGCAAQRALPESQCKSSPLSGGLHYKAAQTEKEVKAWNAIYLVNNLLNCSQTTVPDSANFTKKEALPYDHYFLIILSKLLSSGEFGLDGPGALFLYFIFVCYDFPETLGIHRKLGISAFNIFFFTYPPRDWSLFPAVLSKVKFLWLRILIKNDYF